ncbi:hypothetical protein [Actinomadura sp. HBU206391]|uniref:hypothetical protein n=1 Tax=Actinomadura sp. HBU206391 TaxID=2731692 RepID=UPI0016505774|nr:hypothetical protein [Actinomadura sp. HBU206391]MBC6457374.1 hypothetical protein [Actinomadura sp. HBU206391]
MSESKPTAELHLRVLGQPTEWTLFLHGEPPTEDELKSWMQDGVVARVLFAEQGSNEPHTLLVNFSLIVSARLFPVAHGREISF